MHAGHRGRLKKEFQENGLAHFPNHKILEMLLFYTIPRNDTNELGHELLQRFGSLSGVFDAPFDLLMETKGIGRETALFIKFISQVMGAYLDDYATQNNRIESIEMAKDFMAHKFVGKQVEQIMIACLAANGRVVFCGVLGEGSPETVGVRPVDVVKIALRSNAVQVVLAHNHPNGISNPSSADLRTTSVIYGELKRVEVELFDHIIVASDGVYSMLENGMLPSASR